MENFVILTDSTSDLNRELREKYGIEYVKMNYVVEDKEYPADLDWTTHSPKEFYDMMRNGKRVRTTQVSRETYEKAFTAYLEEGRPVVYIACSSALSGSINLAKLVAQELLASYPQGVLYCIDSLCSSLGQGHMAIWASRLRAEGKSAAEVAQIIEENKLKVNQSGTVDSLEYLRRAGRIKASKAFFGNLFGVKPIIISDRIGQNYAVKKVKGAANARKEIAAQLAEVVEQPEDQCLYISHADAEESAELLKKEILTVCPFAKVHIDLIRPIVGASVGPGTVIAFCYGKEVTIEGKE